MDYPNYIVEVLSTEDIVAEDGDRYVMGDYGYTDFNAAVQGLMIYGRQYGDANVRLITVTDEMRDEWDLLALELADSRLFNYAIG